MKAVDAGLDRSLLPFFPDDTVDFLSRLDDNFFDASGVNPAVGNQFREGESGDLAPNGVETGNGNRIGSIVDDDVDAGRRLERPNVSTFAANNSTLHLFVGQGNNGDDDVGNLLGGASLNRQ